MEIQLTELVYWILLIICGTAGAHFALTVAPRAARRIARRKGDFDPRYERLSVIGLIRALLLRPFGPGRRSALDSWTDQT